MPRLDDNEFHRLRRFLHDRFGLNYCEAKRGMLEARLQKRLRILGHSSFKQYFDFLFSPKGHEFELDAFLHEITTHKTEFFRQPDQFDFLKRLVLPVLHKADVGINSPLRIWSAACSSGEEPYSIAMTASDSARHDNFIIEGTDISRPILESAQLAVYSEESVAHMADDMRSRYFLRSRDRSRRLVRVVPEIRDKVRFSFMNLNSDSYGFEHQFQIIFCRNVIIYFDRLNQERLLLRVCNQLTPGGWLFTGNAETICGMNLPLKPIAPSIYRRTA
jgi:chemotaxis protein methyltransferase CheR